ncbi:hypothetical protein DVH05_026808 [Phytophthora capsici]|nr:hypothetical protein DVH05_026808 [Phytophthora capsici]
MFEGDLYLFADSGFAPDTAIAPVSKKPRNAQLTGEQVHFNQELSMIRVWNEHCIGILVRKDYDSSFEMDTTENG